MKEKVKIGKNLLLNKVCVNCSTSLSVCSIVREDFYFLNPKTCECWTPGTSYWDYRKNGKQE